MRKGSKHYSSYKSQCTAQPAAGGAQPQIPGPPLLPPCVPRHDLHPGNEAPDMVNVVIEIPRGSKVKYELDKDTGLCFVDRILWVLADCCDPGSCG